MEKGTELELKSLINSVKELKGAYENPDNEETKKIKEYIIASIEDYNDTKKKIIDLINKNPEIFHDGLKYSEYGHWLNLKYDGGKVIDIMFENKVFDTYYSNSAPHKELDRSLVYDHSDCCRQYCFMKKGDNSKSYEYNRKNITETKFDMNTLVNLQIRADKTRKVTKLLIQYFKDSLNYQLDTYKKNLNKFSAGALSKYQKVDFD